MTATLPDTTTPLSRDETITAMTAIMNGKCEEDDIAKFLTDMAERGETVDEITGAATVLRSKVTPIKAPHNAVDCCGTGGDASGTYNISTAVALVAASCGVPVAKHGNRAASSKSGAADVLEALGVNLDISIPRLEEALETYNFCFLMAPNHHQAMKHVAPIRKKLERRTIFNLLGPLANPAGTKLQLIGVYDQKLLTPIAQTLKALGTKRAWIVHGTDGLDEITTTGPTNIAVLDDGIITEKTLTPEDFGFSASAPENIKGGNADENATALRRLLEGEKSAYRDIVIANTAAVLTLHGKAKDIKEGAKQAADAIDNGYSYQTLKDYIAFSRETLEEA